MDSSLRRKLNQNHLDTDVDRVDVEQLWSNEPRGAFRLAQKVHAAASAPLKQVQPVAIADTHTRGEATSITCGTNTELSFGELSLNEIETLKNKSVSQSKIIFDLERTAVKADVEISLLRGQLEGRIRALNVLRETLLRDLIHANQQLTAAERKLLSSSNSSADFTYLDAFRLLETSVSADSEDEATRLLQAIRSAMDVERFRSRTLFEERIKSLELQVTRLDKELAESRLVEQGVKQTIADACDELKRRHALETADMEARHNVEVAGLHHHYTAQLDNKEEELAKATLNLREALRRGTLRRRDTVRRSVADLGATRTDSTMMPRRSSTGQSPVVVDGADQAESESSSLADLNDYDLEEVDTTQHILIEQLETKVANFQATIAEKDKDIAKLKAIVAQATMDKGGILEKLKTSDAQLEAAREENSSLFQKTQSLEATLSTNGKLLHVSETSLRATELLVQQLRQQLAVKSASSLGSDTSPTLSSERDAMSRAEKEIEEMHSRHDSLESKCSMLERERNDALAQLRTMQNTIDQLQEAALANAELMEAQVVRGESIEVSADFDKGSPAKSNLGGTKAVKRHSLKRTVQPIAADFELPVALQGSESSPKRPVEAGSPPVTRKSSIATSPIVVPMVRTYPSCTETGVQTDTAFVASSSPPPISRISISEIAHLFPSLNSSIGVAAALRSLPVGDQRLVLLACLNELPSTIARSVLGELKDETLWRFPAISQPSIKDIEHAIDWIASSLSELFNELSHIPSLMIADISVGSTSEVQDELLETLMKNLSTRWNPQSEKTPKASLTVTPFGKNHPEIERGEITTLTNAAEVVCKRLTFTGNELAKRLQLLQHRLQQATFRLPDDRPGSGSTLVQSMLQLLSEAQSQAPQQEAAPSPPQRKGPPNHGKIFSSVGAGFGYASAASLPSSKKSQRVATQQLNLNIDVRDTKRTTPTPERHNPQAEPHTDKMEKEPRCDHSAAVEFAFSNFVRPKESSLQSDRFETLTDFKPVSIRSDSFALQSSQEIKVFAGTEVSPTQQTFAGLTTKVAYKPQRRRVH